VGVTGRTPTDEWAVSHRRGRPRRRPRRRRSRAATAVSTVRRHRWRTG